MSTDMKFGAKILFLLAKADCAKGGFSYLMRNNQMCNSNTFIGLYSLETRITFCFIFVYTGLVVHTMVINEIVFRFLADREEKWKT